MSHTDWTSGAVIDHGITIPQPQTPLSSILPSSAPRLLAILRSPWTRRGQGLNSCLRLLAPLLAPDPGERALGQSELPSPLPSTSHLFLRQSRHQGRRYCRQPVHLIPNAQQSSLRLRDLRIQRPCVHAPALLSVTGHQRSFRSPAPIRRWRREQRPCSRSITVGSGSDRLSC